MLYISASWEASKFPAILLFVTKLKLIVNWGLEVAHLF